MTGTVSMKYQFYTNFIIWLMSHFFSILDLAPNNFIQYRNAKNDASLVVLKSKIDDIKEEGWISLFKQCFPLIKLETSSPRAEQLCGTLQPTSASIMGCSEGIDGLKQRSPI